jgi:hypothetical protein
LTASQSRDTSKTLAQIPSHDILKRHVAVSGNDERMNIDRSGSVCPAEAHDLVIVLNVFAKR